MRRGKYFGIQEVAHMFGQTIEWILSHERQGHFKDEDGLKIQPIRYLTPMGKLGQRYYTLDMVEEMAESCAREKVISKYQVERIVNLINAYRKVKEYAKNKRFRSKWDDESPHY